MELRHRRRLLLSSALLFAQHTSIVLRMTQMSTHPWVYAKFAAHPAFVFCQPHVRWKFWVCLSLRGLLYTLLGERKSVYPSSDSLYTTCCRMISISRTHRLKVGNKPWTGHQSMAGHTPFTFTPWGNFRVTNWPKFAGFWTCAYKGKT